MSSLLLVASSSFGRWACSLLRCSGSSLPGLLLSWNTGLGPQALVAAALGSGVVALRFEVHGLSSCDAVGLVASQHVIFLDQGSNPCPLPWQANS